MISARDLLQMVVVGTLIALFAIFVARPYSVSGESMLPTYKPGNLVIVSKLASINSEDIVVVQTQYGEMIKRIIKFNEAGDLWLEGDNKNFSTDSREYGWVKRENVVGRVVVKAW